MTPDDLDQAIAWFDNQRPTMPGARKMYELVYAALKALRVDQEQLEDLSWDDLIATIHYLRAACINRGKLIDRLEDENYQLREKGRVSENRKNADPPNFKTIRQTAALGILPEHRIRLLVAAGRCPGIKAGNRFLVNVSALAEMLEAESRKGLQEGRKDE